MMPFDPLPFSARSCHSQLRRFILSFPAHATKVSPRQKAASLFSFARLFSLAHTFAYYFDYDSMPPRRRHWRADAMMRPDGHGQRSLLANTRISTWLASDARQRAPQYAGTLLISLVDIGAGRAVYRFTMLSPPYRLRSILDVAAMSELQQGFTGYDAWIASIFAHRRCRRMTSGHFRHVF